MRLISPALKGGVLRREKIIFVKVITLKKFIASASTALLALASNVALLIASAWLITTAAFRPPLSELALGITAVRAAGIFRAVFRYLERLATHSAALEVLNSIRVRLYQIALLKLPLKSGASMQGEFLHSLTVRAELNKDFIPRVVIPIVCSSVLIVVSTAILFRSIGIIALLLPTAFFLIVIVSKIVKETPVDDSRYRERLLDFHDGFDELFIADDFNRARTILDAHSKTPSDTRIINADSACAFINAAVFCCLMYFLAARLDMINLAMHLFLLLINLETLSTLPPAIRLAEQIRPIENAEPKKILPIEIAKNDITVSIENLKFGYDDRLVTDDLNLEVRRAEQIAIVGESGVGKTTLLYLLLGLWKPDGGSIKINGSIAAATNANYIFAASIRDNFLLLHPKIDDETIADCLKAAQLEGLDVNTDIGIDGAKLSGGQRCRLQTALALAANSDILILDEPTAGLDRATAERLIDAVKKKSRALIVITHDPSVAEKFSVVYRMIGGRIEKLNPTSS